jgi:NAD(P)-dependent dehydrogenase (short-subunit alcohol dehydrogenase family)
VNAESRPVAVITGAGGGVGLACARRLVQTHALILADASEASLERARKALTGPGVGARVDVGAAYAVCDVSEPDDVAKLAALTRASGDFHLLLHTAGISRSMADGPRVVEVNLRGTALVLDALLPLARDGSVAVCLSSIGAHRREIEALDELLDPAAPDFPTALEARLPLSGRSGAAYDLSKRGVVLLCERRAAAWGARGARLLSLSPGPIDTEMGRLEGLRDAGGLERLAALGRVAQPDEVAAAALMLCGEDARYVTGCDVRVDGGTLAGIRHHSPASTAQAWDRLRAET